MKTIATDPKYRVFREAFNERTKQDFKQKQETETMSTATASPASPSTIQQQPPPVATGQNTNTKPLWSIPIEILGLTGDFASGKTLFALSISPGPSTLIYDTEKSAKPYAQSLGFDRVDLPGEMLKSHPGGFKPIDMFNHWWKSVKAVRPGKYRVVIIDTVSEIESGLVAYVRENPAQFGYTSAQFARGQALLWGAVKEFWKAILTDLASRCETFVFTSHLKREFAGDRPTSTKTPKGKETLTELASLYLWLDRGADKKGNVPAAPSATVLKSRLSAMVVLENGLMDIRPSLPPRLPVATPASVRFYLDNPPDYSKLKADERVRETEISEAEMEALKLARAEAERDAAALQLERFKSAATAATTSQRPTQPAPQSSQQSPASVAPVQAPAPSTNGANTNSQHSQHSPNAAVNPYSNGVRKEQLDAIIQYRGQLKALGLTDDAYRGALAKRGVQSARDFTHDQADEFLAALLKKMQQLNSPHDRPAGAASVVIPNEQPAALATTGTPPN